MARINYCQSQYNTLSSNYTALNHSFENLWSALNSLGQYNIEGDTLKAGYYSVAWVVVPSGFTGTIHITMSSTSPLHLYVFNNIIDFVQWTQGSSYSYIYYQNGNYIDYTLSEGPGLYFIVVYNPSNGDVTYSLTVTTTYAGG
jgi:hypothetical protein